MSTRRSALACFSPVWSLLFATGPAAQGHRLNEPLAQGYLGDVFAGDVTAAGRVVFASRPFGAHLGLFSAPVDGSALPIELGPPLVFPFVGEIAGLALAPDGTRAVFEFEAFDGSETLHSVPVDGSAPAVLLGPDFLSGREVFDPEVSADSTRVVYLQGLVDDPIRELFSAPIDGSANPVRLNTDLPYLGSVLGFVVSPDSSRVVYWADQDAQGVSEVYSVPIDGSATPVKLNPALPAGRGAAVSRISPDSTRVVYLSDQVSDDVLELFSVPIDGSASPVQLSAIAAAGGDVLGDFEISPDSARVVYVADQLTDDVHELFSAPIDGSAAPVRLSGTLVAGGDVLAPPFPHGFAISPDASRVVYVADQLTDGVHELFGSPIDGSASPVRLSGVLVAGGQVGGPGERDFAISPDASRIVYVADQLTDDVLELFSAPIDGSASPVRLNGTLVPGGDVVPSGTWPEAFAISSDSARVVYGADQQVDERFELFGAPIDGTGPVLPLAPACMAGSASGIAIHPATGRLVFAAELGAPGSSELLSAPIDGSQPPVNLSAAPQFSDTVGDVASFAQSPDGRRLVYGAHEERDACSGPALYGLALDGRSSPVNLTAPLVSPLLQGIGGSRAVFATAAPPGIYSAPIDGSSPPVLLRAGAPTQFFQPGVLLAADGGTVLVVADDAQYVRELFAVPIDGSLPAWKLSAPMVQGGDVGSVILDPTAHSVAYVADQAVDEVLELFVVPLDGDEPARRLNAPLVAGGDVSTARFSPDGSWIVYLADQVADGVTELFSVLARAAPRVRSPSGPPPVVKLDRALVPGGDVTSFEIAPGGERVVYLADQELDERVELYSVPIDGISAPVRLNATLAAGGDVSAGLRITPDGTRVVYRADQEVDERFELYSAPIDGSAAPVKLSTTPVPAGDVSTLFEISVDGARVVYVADPGANERFELFSTPVDGSAPATKLNPTPVLGGDVLGFELSPDGAGVVYRADQDVNGREELYAVPIDGGSAPRKLVPALVSGGNVVEFAVVGGGTGVVYRADALADERFELFLSYLTPAVRRAP